MAECFDADADADETVDVAKVSFGFVLMSASDSGAFGVFDVEASVVGPDHVGECFDGVAFYAVTQGEAETFGCGGGGEEECFA